MVFASTVIIVYLIFLYLSYRYDTKIKMEREAARSEKFWRKYNYMREIRRNGDRSWTSVDKHFRWNMRRMHPWLFLFRDQGDFLTSMKRVSISFALIFTAMVVSALLYNQQQRLPYVDSNISIALLSCILTIPILTVLAALFSRPVPPVFFVMLDGDYTNTVCNVCILCSVFVISGELEDNDCCGGAGGVEAEHESDDFVMGGEEVPPDGDANEEEDDRDQQDFNDIKTLETNDKVEIAVGPTFARLHQSEVGDESKGNRQSSTVKSARESEISALEANSTGLVSNREVELDSMRLSWKKDLSDSQRDGQIEEIYGEEIWGTEEKELDRKAAEAKKKVSVTRGKAKNQRKDAGGKGGISSVFRSSHRGVRGRQDARTKSSTSNKLITARQMDIATINNSWKEEERLDAGTFNTGGKRHMATVSSIFRRSSRPNAKKQNKVTFASASMVTHSNTRRSQNSWQGEEFKMLQLVSKVDTHKWHTRDGIGAGLVILVLLGCFFVLVPLSYAMRHEYSGWVEATLLSLAQDIFLRALQIFLLELVLFAPATVLVCSCCCICLASKADGGSKKGGSTLQKSASIMEMQSVSIGRTIPDENEGGLSVMFKAGNIGFYFRNLMVSSVDRMSQADKLGVQPGMYIVTVNEVHVLKQRHAAKLLHRAHRLCVEFPISFAISTEEVLQRFELQMLSQRTSEGNWNSSAKQPTEISVRGGSQRSNHLVKVGKVGVEDGGGVSDVIDTIRSDSESESESKCDPVSSNVGISSVSAGEMKTLRPISPSNSGENCVSGSDLINENSQSITPPTANHTFQKRSPPPAPTGGGRPGTAQHGMRTLV